MSTTSRFKLVFVVLALLTFCSLPSNVLHAQTEPPRNIAVIFYDGMIEDDLPLPPTVMRFAAFGIDIFVGGEIDLVGIFGIELGGGLVIDLDSPLDSGIFVSGGVGAGINVGAGVGGGLVIGGDLEGEAVTLDVNFGAGSGIGGMGSDGSVVVGGSYGPGIGGSVTGSSTGTLSIQDVIDFFAWIFAAP